jgi:hypothetical protein
MASRAALAARRLSASLAGARPAACVAGGAPQALSPLAAAAWQLAQRRRANFWDVFSREKAAERRAQLCVSHHALSPALL